MSESPTREEIEGRLQRANEVIEPYLGYENIECIEWTEDDLYQRSGRIRGLLAEVNSLLSRVVGEVFGEDVDTSEAEEELRETRRYLRAYLNDKSVDEVSRR